MNPHSSVLLSAALLALGMVWPRSVGVAGDALALIPAGSHWRYWDRTNCPGDAGRGLAFDDRGWSHGPAMLGFGEADGVFPTTFIASNRQWTAYFRHHFVVANAAAYTNFVLSLQRDDGAVVWLNGNEIWRHGMPETGLILPDTPATRDVGGPNEARFWSTYLVSMPLESGTNVLAVEDRYTSYVGNARLRTLKNGKAEPDNSANEIPESWSGRPSINLQPSTSADSQPARPRRLATLETTC